MTGYSRRKMPIYHLSAAKKGKKRGRRSRRKTRSTIADRRSIHERPQEVEDRKIVGH